MKTFASIALMLGLIGWAGLAAQAQDKKDEKKTDAPKLEGKYTLVGGKTGGKDIEDEVKKGSFSFTADKITIEGMGMKFVMGYKLDTKATPIAIDMEILEGPEGAKGSKAQGIIEVKGEMLKLAYSMEKDKRPKNFDGKEGNMYEFKKAK